MLNKLKKPITDIRKLHRIFSIFTLVTCMLVTCSVLLQSFAVIAQAQEQAQETKPTTKEEESIDERDSITSTPTPLVPDTPPQTGIDLTLSPVFINLVTDPGKQTSSQIKIKNNNNEKEFLRISLVRFEPSDDGARPKIVDIDPNDEFINWISFSDPEFTLAPNETKTIDISVTPPETAGLGYYYGVMFQRISEGALENTPQAVVSGAPVVSLLLEVKSPNAKRELQLVDFTTDKLFYEYLPTQFNVTVENTGNIHLIPFGNVFIDSMTKKDVAVLLFNDARGNILPNSKRVYSLSWNDAMILGSTTDENGNPVQKTSYDLSKADKFRIGKYTANLLMVYDNGERDVPVEATISFWVIPWKILGIAGVIGLFVAVGIRSSLLSFIKKLRSKK